MLKWIEMMSLMGEDSLTLIRERTRAQMDNSLFLSLEWDEICRPKVEEESHTRRPAGEGTRLRFPEVDKGLTCPMQPRYNLLIRFMLRQGPTLRTH